MFRSSSFKEWQVQTDALLDQAAPVNGTWYTVLANTGRYTLIRHIFAAVQVANETVDVEVTVDGVTLSGTTAFTAGTNYVTRSAANPTVGNALYGQSAIGTMLDPWDLIGHNVTIRIRKTTAAGAGNLQCKVVYAVA